MEVPGRNQDEVWRRVPEMSWEWIDYVAIKMRLDFLEIKVQPHKCISKYIKELLYCVFLYLW